LDTVKRLTINIIKIIYVQITANDIPIFQNFKTFQISTSKF